MQAHFSDPTLARSLLTRIHDVAQRLPPISIMEVCGTHTVAIGKLGLRQLLPPSVRLISGPGCPVCITPPEIIDTAVQYAHQPNHILVTFGDMIRVPGTVTTLDKAAASGARVEIVTSPLALIELAQRNPACTVVFTAVGFETTLPTVARTLEIASQLELKNLKVLITHRLLPPALRALSCDTELTIAGFLLPGHVCAIIGSAWYISETSLRVPAVVTGFDPLDILSGIYTLVTMIDGGKEGVVNAYRRVARDGGNPQARALIARVFGGVQSARWRGIGSIEGSAPVLRREYARFEAPLTVSEPSVPPIACGCGSVLTGRITPVQCTLFGSVCTPHTPVGPCMVSNEGSCAAYYRYERGSLCG